VEPDERLQLPPAGSGPVARTLVLSHPMGTLLVAWHSPCGQDIGVTTVWAHCW
jgi:hypothetical protein